MRMMFRGKVVEVLQKGKHTSQIEDDGNQIWVKTSMLKPATRIKPPFSERKAFLIEHSMIRYTAKVFDTEPEYQDLAGRTTSWEREDFDTDRYDETKGWLKGNPEFVEICRQLLVEGERFPIQAAVEEYRRPIKSYENPKLEALKRAALERKQKEYENISNDVDAGFNAAVDQR